MIAANEIAHLAAIAVFILFFGWVGFLLVMVAYDETRTSNSETYRDSKRAREWMKKKSRP
jgi:hypothetical protein